jgi:hypothetical protein
MRLFTGFMMKNNVEGAGDSGLAGNAFHNATRSSVVLIRNLLRCSAEG